MLVNRSMPIATIIPVLGDPDLAAAVTWLSHTFGLVERLRIGNHRAQLSYGDGAVVVVQRAPTPQGVPNDAAAHLHSIMVRVEDVDEHYLRAKRGGARIEHPPSDFPYGERQYTAVDPGGHVWTFSQSIADVDPGSWGGVLVGGRL